MTVADQIIERVKAMSPEAQEQLLRFAEQLAQMPDDEDLERWIASAAKRGMAGWPREDWAQDFAEWKSRHPDGSDATG